MMLPGFAGGLHFGVGKDESYQLYIAVLSGIMEPGVQRDIDKENPGT